MASHGYKQLVHVKSKAGKGGYKPAAHELDKNFSYGIVRIANAESFSSSVITSGSKHNIRWKLDDLPKGTKCRKATLAYQVAENNTGDAYFCPTAYKTEEIDWHHGNKSFKQDYADTVYVENCAMVEDKKQNFRDLNISRGYSRGALHKQNTSKWYRINLVGNPIFNNDLDLGSLGQANDIIAHMNFGSSVTSSGSGVATLTAVRLELDIAVPTNAERAAIMKMYRSPKPIVLHYLDPIRVPQKTSQALTASAEYSLDLKVLDNKKVSFLLFGIRADSYGVSNEGVLKLLNLGPDATVDITTNSDESKYGETRAVNADLLMRDHVISQLGNEKFFQQRAWYIIPFTENMKAGFHGVKDGFMSFGRDWKLKITPSAAGTSEVQTVTPSGTADAGEFNYVVQSREIASVTTSYDHDLSAANQKTALEATRAFIDYPNGPLTVTSSGAVNASHTLTFPANLPPPSDNDLEIQALPVSMNDGGVATEISVSRTTTGQLGWTTASTYTVDCYGFCHRTLQIKNGQIDKVTWD